MASIENSLKHEAEVGPGKVRLVASGEFVRAYNHSVSGTTSHAMVGTARRAVRHARPLAGPWHAIAAASARRPYHARTSKSRGIR